MPLDTEGEWERMERRGGDGSTFVWLDESETTEDMEVLLPCLLL